MTTTKKEIEKLVKSKLDPHVWDTSPLMKAILGFITNIHAVDPKILSFYISTDRHILAQVENDIGYNYHIGTVFQFLENIKNLCMTAELSTEELNWVQNTLNTKIPDLSCRFT